MERTFGNGSITFASKNDTFYSGQRISGKINFTIDTPITFGAIAVRFIGEAVVLWKEYDSEEYNGQARTREVEYKGHEEYFNFIQYLAGDNRGPTTLNPGTYSFPFQYQTPPVAPSSFEDDKGKVWYRVVAYIERQRMQPNPNEQFEKIFYLNAPLNLNDVEEAKKPIDLEFEEVYSCCFCESKPLNIRVNLPVSGFCPGQLMPIKVELDNASNVEVQKLLFSITENRAYHSQHPKADYEIGDTVIAKLNKGPIPSHVKRDFVVDMRVPDILAPNLDNCKIIDVFHFFKVEVEVSGCNDGTDDEADIIIGQIPLAGFQDSNYVHPMAHSLPQPLGQKVPELEYPSNTPYSTPIAATNVSQNESTPYTIGFVTNGVQQSVPRYPGYPYPDDPSSYKPAPYPVPPTQPIQSSNFENKASAPSAPTL